MSYNYIAIEGTIGAGKTSLAKMMANDFNAKLVLEEFEDNSFLPKFYKNPEKYAFPLELSFLAERFQQLRSQLAAQDLFHDFTISDYFINKSLIFARKTLPSDIYSLYSNLFEIISLSLPRPELLVYLYMRVDRLQENIRKRGRSYEQEIEDSYLENIQSGYLEFLRRQENMRILIIDTNKLDFVANPADYKKLTDAIMQEYDIGVREIIP